MVYTVEPRNSAGGLEEYEAVRALAAGVEPEEWTTTDQRLLNRSRSPILMLFLRRPSKGQGQH